MRVPQRMGGKPPTPTGAPPPPKHPGCPIHARTSAHGWESTTPNPRLFEVISGKNTKAGCPIHARTSAHGWESTTPNRRLFKVIPSPKHEGLSANAEEPPYQPDIHAHYAVIVRVGFDPHNP
jgi:hypothetical protein